MVKDIKIRINTNTTRNTVIEPSSRTPKEILREQSINFGTAIVHLDGSPLSAQEMNTPFSELIRDSEECILACVVKASNA